MGKDNQPFGNYKGYNLYQLGWSLSCPKLKLYGYGSPKQLLRAIDKKCKVQNQPLTSR